MTKDVVPAGIMGKRPFLHLTGRCFLAKKLFFSPKKRVFFYLPTFLGRAFFLGPKTRFSARKSFFAITSNFVNGLFEAFGKTVH